MTETDPEKMRALQAEHDEFEQALESLSPKGHREKRELLCEICGREHRAWVAASPLWNAVVRGGSINGDEEFNFLCADCFMGLAEDRDIASVFQVRAERSIALETVTPSGRVWNDAEFAFVEPSPQPHSHTEDALREAREIFALFVEGESESWPKNIREGYADKHPAFIRLLAALTASPTPCSKAGEDELRRALRELREAAQPFADTVVIDPTKKRGERHWATTGKLTDLDDVLRLQAALSNSVCGDGE